MEKGKSGLILWVTYPGEGMASFLWVTYPGKQKDGEWSHCMGDLPRKNDGLIVWVTYPGKMMENGLIVWVTYPEK